MGSVVVTGRWVGSVVVTGRWVGSPNAANGMTVFGPGLALVGAGWAISLVLSINGLGKQAHCVNLGAS